MVLYAILDHVVDGYEEAAEGIDVDIQQVERQVFSADWNQPGGADLQARARGARLPYGCAPLSGVIDEVARDHVEVVPMS